MGVGSYSESQCPSNEEVVYVTSSRGSEWSPGKGSERVSFGPSELRPLCTPLSSL